MRADVVDLLTAMGRAMRRRGDAGRARAYLRAARAVQRREDFDALLRAGRLRDIEGIGASIERSILAFVERGERPAWLLRAPAAGVADLLPEGARYADDLPFADAPDLHVHTTWSDGTLSVEEVARVAEALGARVLGVSDHSGSLRIANGLSPDEVRRQWEELARVEALVPGVRLLRGTECDILRDGSLDHPDDILRGFDYVIGSLHSHLRLPEREQTPRVLAALRHPLLDVLGHPTTRVPGRRDPANLDLDRVFRAAADHDVAVEVNGNPGRLDLDAKLARRALAAGCRLALASDAHRAGEMLAFDVARRLAAEAGAREEDVFDPRAVASRRA